MNYGHAETPFDLLKSKPAFVYARGQSSFQQT